jgi:hypothetical protein
MRRFHPAAVALIVLGLFASACLVGTTGCNSDPHDTHVRSNVAAAR